MVYRVMSPVWVDGVQQDECLLQTKDRAKAYGFALELAEQGITGVWIQER